MLLLWLLALSASSVLAASPPADFQIRNRAQATYVQFGHELPETIYSNTVVAVVSAVESLQLTHDWTVHRPAGSIVTLPHTLANTGNIPSTYTFDLVNLIGDDFDLTVLALVHDLDNDGMADPDEPLLTFGEPEISLAPGEFAALLVIGRVPPDSATATAHLLLTAATITAISAGNTDTIHTGSQASVLLTKNADRSGTVYPGMTVNYHLVATNIGDQYAGPSGLTGEGGTAILIDGQPATVFLIRDEIPVGTRYVPGSLSTSRPNAFKLFRLPGDSPHQYRTNGDDIAAVEVAAASLSGLPVNSTTDMRFSLIVKDGYSGPIVNSGDVYYDNGVAPTSTTSNEIVLRAPLDRIGLAKRAGEPIYEQDPQTGLLLGTARVRFTFVLESFSSSPLSNVQIKDVLEGANLFGDYTASQWPEIGEYTIVAGSELVTSRGSGAGGSFNPAYTGTAGFAALLAPGAYLPVDGVLEVSFEMRINAIGIDGLFYNNADAVAAVGDPVHGTVNDESVNGDDPDANNDGDPNNDTSPTPVLLSLPDLQVKKTAGEPRRVATGSSSWEVEYTLAVTNTGKTLAPHVRVSDNLNCAFRTYLSPSPVQSWELIAGPTAQHGLLAINNGYTGNAVCSARQTANSSPYLAMPREPEVMLTDGSRHLDPGATEVIQYTVRFTIDPLLNVNERAFTNYAYAAIFDRTDANDGEIIVASASSAIVTPLDPSGVVYYSDTRQPVAGAEVRLFRGTCANGPGGPITAAEILALPGTTYTYNADGSVAMTTGVTGAYFFYLLSPPVTDNCDYRLAVTPPGGEFLVWPSDLIPPTPGFAPGGAVQVQDTAPPGNQPTVYYLEMRLGPGLPVIINNHIPIDSVPESKTFFLEKTGSREEMEIGDSIEYTLRLGNATGNPLNGFSIVDLLPFGFRFVEGSARLGGQAVADPAGSPGRELLFAFPGRVLAINEKITLVYRAQAGVGTPLEDAINSARAYSGSFSSNMAAWKVRVEGGVFAEEAYLIGKVFLDCNRDGMQGHEEIGIPGVRLLMEDGTGVVTDVEGKYSLYGLRAITHILKLDATTLPPGSHLEILDNRNSAQGDSRFVDLKKGELHKANFAVDNCEEPTIVDAVQRRRELLSERPDAEGEAVSKARLALQPQAEPVPDTVRNRAAEGELSPTGIKMPTTDTTPSSGEPSTFESLMPRYLAGPSSLPEPPVAKLPMVELEALLPGSDNSLAFIDLVDGDTLPMALTNVRVKGRLGTILQLSVNGRPLSAKRVGKRARLADRQLEAWEYIGVELAEGANTLVLEGIDSFGNVRDRREITLIAPGDLGRIEIDAPETAVADGATPVHIKVRLTDNNGVPVTVRTQLTLETDTGRWETKDLNPREPGTQMFIQGGMAEFAIIPPNQPGDGIVRVSAGMLRQEVEIAYLPELRPLIGAGIIEGVLDFRDRGMLPVSRANRDAFEQTLRNLSWESDDNERSATGRTAFFFKGAIRGQYLLTVAYDSDKDTRERLFRDIQPNKFYPIYGDSSAKIFDAQSSERLYLRIDKEKSWLLFGDFVTDDDDNIRQLSNYNRAVTGAKYHHENDRLSANVYASKDSLSQKVIEIPANGTSGPYHLDSGGEFFENSEQVEIVTRDRHQPSVILKTVQMIRFTDYMIEPLSGRLFFTAPVASLDENLNPRFIRVTCEVDSNGPTFWMYGGDAQLQINRWLQVGGSHVHDDNPDNVATLSGATAMIKLDESSVVTVELAQSDTDLSDRGEAARLEWIKDAGDLKLRAQVITADENFDNPSSGFGKGRSEATLDGVYHLSKSTLRGEAIYSRDAITGGERMGGLATVSTPLTDNLDGELGLRVSNETTEPAQKTTVGATPNDLLTVRGRLGLQMPWLRDARTYIEAEQDVRDSKKRLASVGGDYQINEKSRLYGRYEFISSLGSPFALNDVQEHNTAVLGVETAYLQSGRFFNEFRLRDSINGQEALSATGVRQTWTVAENWRLGGSLEHTDSFGDIEGNDSTAVTTSLEYAGNRRYRLYGTVETRFADAGDSYLNILGATYKLDKDWSLLARSAVSLQKNSGDQSELLLSRQQIGLAWRQVDIDRWNGLGRYEYKTEDLSGGSAPTRDEFHIVSMHLNYQPKRSFIANGRYAFKWGEETYNGLSSDFQAHLLYARVTQDLPLDFDVSLQSGTMWDMDGGRKYALGVECGRQMMANLWFSLGYNLWGFHDDELTRGDYLDRGFYLRLRFKFDERLFQ